MKAFGVNKIASEPIESIDLSNVKELFSSPIQRSWNEVESRPSGEVELLIGQNYAGLHPTVHETNGNLIVYRSLFDSGFTIGGSHNSLQSSGISWDATASYIRNHEVQFNQVTYKSVRDYMESCDLSVPTPRRCNNCLNCSECSFRGHMMTVQHQYEYKVLEDHVEYEEATKSFN